MSHNLCVCVPCIRSLAPRWVYWPCPIYTIKKHLEKQSMLSTFVSLIQGFRVNNTNGPSEHTLTSSVTIMAQRRHIVKLLEGKSICEDACSCSTLRLLLKKANPAKNICPWISNFSLKWEGCWSLNFTVFLTLALEEVFLTLEEVFLSLEEVCGTNYKSQSSFLESKQKVTANSK